MPARLSRLAAVALLLALGPISGALCVDNSNPRPVGVQELSLLLRSGYTGDEVLRETAGRPLLAPLDAAAQRALLDAGADARTMPSGLKVHELLARIGGGGGYAVVETSEAADLQHLAGLFAALRAGRAVASQTEASEAQRRQAAVEQYRLEAWEAEQARRAEAGRQALNSRLAARREESLKQGGTLLRDKLVVCAHDRLEPYDNAALAGKRIFLLYAAGGSDPASHVLTPQLVEFYKKFAPAHPDFELVLVSGDRSAADLERHMKREKMPWPALAFEQIAQEPDLAALRKDGLPRLRLVDGSGQTIADNFDNGKLTNSQRVIDTLLRMYNPK